MESLLFSPAGISCHSSTQTTRVILVRHARTTYNERGIYQGSSDKSVLTKQGHRDAYTTGLALQQYDFDAIYTSPLTRVRQTAKEIIAAAKTSDVPLYVEPKLTEVCMADWQGLSYGEVKEKYPQDYACWQNAPHLFTRDRLNYPVLELYQQANNFWQETLRKHRGETILIVAHGGTNRALISTAIALSPQYYQSLQQCNCGISCLEFSPNSELATLRYLNNTNHLGKTLPKLKAGKTGWRWLVMSDNYVHHELGNSYLDRVLHQNGINLILTDNNRKAQALVNRFQKSSSSALHISTEQRNFLNIWQQTIAVKQKVANSPATSGLFTGLIVVSEELKAQMLRQITNVEAAADSSNCLNVIHYPHAECRAILQGMIPLDSSQNFSIDVRDRAMRLAG